MKKINLILSLIIILALSASAQDMNDVRSRIELLNKTFAQAMMNNDVETMTSLYTDDIISLPSYQPMLRGLASVKQSSEGMVASGVKTTHFVLTTVDIIPSGDLIIEIGNYDMKMSIPGMEEAWPDNGKYITIWKKQSDGSYKMMIETWNSDNNPWQEMGMGEEMEAEGHHQHEEEE